MAIRHLSYLDLELSKRKEYANAYRKQIRQSLASPFMTADQTRALQGQLERIGKWENGTLEVSVSPAPAPAPQEELLLPESTPEPTPEPLSEPEVDDEPEIVVEIEEPEDEDPQEEDETTRDTEPDDD